MGNRPNQAWGDRLEGNRLQARRSDVIVELERFDTVDVPLLYQEVEVTVRYFASLPVANPDGTRGIAMHVIYRPPIPHAKFDEVNQHFNEWYPPREHRGIVHTMFCGARATPTGPSPGSWAPTASSFWARPSTT